VCSGSQIDYKTFSHNNITHILYVPVATHGHLPSKRLRMQWHGFW
jgi:hypothetical protein